MQTTTLKEAVQWSSASTFEDIRYEKAEGIAKITINRPEVHNAFRPQTIVELQQAFSLVRDDPEIGVAILTGEGPDAFCSGGDQRVRGKAGYVDDQGVPRLNVLDLQRQIRTLPKPVIAMVAGYAIGGGHVLHVVCDLTIAADNARFGQTGPKVGSFDGGFGAALMFKDVRLCLEEAEAMGVPMFVGTGTRQAWSYAVANGEAGEDSTAIMRHYERLAAVEWPEGGAS